MRQCKVCQAWKDPVLDFYHQMGRCKLCHNARCREYAKTHMPEQRARNKAWYARVRSNPDAWRSYLLKKSRYRANKKSLGG